MRPLTRIERRKAIQRRRARNVTLVCVAFAVVVLATSFPASALFRQRQAISEASNDLSTLNSQIHSLRTQAEALSQPQNVAAIARRDYGMVRPGQTAYRVIPTSSSASEAGSVVGQGTLDQGPVVPGSEESQALVGAATGNGSSGAGGTSAGANAGQDPSSQGSQGGHSGGSSPRFWNRVLSTLEFWR
jgi:cell division protein FtsB